MSTASTGAPTFPIQEIELTGSDQCNTHYINSTRVKVRPSSTTSASNKSSTVASNKISSSDLVNYSWSREYYFGNLLSYHERLSLLAYSLKHATKHSSMVKVSNLRTTSRCLLKDFNSTVVDLSFSPRLTLHPASSSSSNTAGAAAVGDNNNTNSAVLGVLQDNGLVRLYQIIVNLGSCDVSAEPLLLLPPTSVIDSIDLLQKSKNGGQYLSLTQEIRLSTSDWLKNHRATPPSSAASNISRLSWCLGEADDETDDVRQLLAISRNGETSVYLVMDLLTSLLSEEEESTINTNDNDNPVDPWLAVTPNLSSTTGLVEKLISPSKISSIVSNSNSDVVGHPLVSDLCFSIAGNAVATATLDGYCHFYEINLNTEIEHDDVDKFKLTVKHVHSWRPHDGDAVYSINFLDNQLDESAGPQWQSALTGANYNRQLKLWRCDRWECMYQIEFEPNINQDLLPALQIRVDATASFVLLSDIKRSVLYVIDLPRRQTALSLTDTMDSKQSLDTLLLPVFGSISEFLLRDHCLSMCLLGPARISRSKQDLSSSLLLSNNFNESRPSSGKYYVCLNLAHIHTKQLKQSRLLFSLQAKEQSNGQSIDFLSREENNTLGLPDVNLSQGHGVSSSFTHVSSDASIEFLKSKLEQVKTPADDNDSEISEEIDEVNSSASELLNTIKTLHLTPRGETTSSGGKEMEMTVKVNEDEQIEEVEAGGISPPPTPVEECEVNQVSSASSSGANSNQKSSEDDWPDVPVPIAQIQCTTESDHQQDRSDLELKNERNVSDILSLGSDQQNNELITRMLNSLLQSNGSQRDCVNKLVYDVNMLLARQNEMLQVQQQMRMQWPPTDPREIWRPLEEVTRAQMDRLDRSFDQRFNQLKDRVEQLSDAIDNRQNNSSSSSAGVTAEDVVKVIRDSNRQLQSEMVTSTVQDIYSQLTTHVRDALQKSLKHSLDQNIPKITEPIRREISQQVQDRLSAAQQAINNHLSQVVSSKEFADQLSKKVATGLQQPFINSYKTVVKQDLVPAIDQSFTKLANDINQAFSHSLNEFENQFTEHVSQRVCMLIKEQNSLREAQMKQDQENLLKRIDSLMQRYTEHMSTDIRSYYTTESKLNESLRLQMTALEHSLDSKLEHNQREMMTHLINLSHNTSHMMMSSPIPNKEFMKARNASSAADNALSVQWNLVQRHIADKQYNNAFSQALTSLHLPLVEFVCKEVPVEILSQVPCPLEQTVLLSLAQQLCTNLETNTMMKLNYIEEALLALDSQSTLCRGQKAKEIFMKIDLKLQQLSESDVVLNGTSEVKNIIRRCRIYCSKATAV